MKFKEVATSNASTEAKVAALALLLDKELIKLADTVLNVKKLEGPKGEQGIQGPKGEQGDRGFDGTNGKDGADGKDGKDGEDGKQGVGVADAKIDFDGSLVITLTDGTEINAGDVVPLDTAEKIRVIGNGGGTSQSVLDAIDAINAIISTYGTMALQDDTAVDINGGAIDGTAIGASSASTGTFTTLTAQTEVLKGTGQNLVSRSQAFSYWCGAGSSNVTGTDNVTTAPDGTTTASSVVPTVTNGLHRTYTPTGAGTATASLGATYTFSFYAKANGYRYIFCNLGAIVGSAVFDVQGGVVTNGTATTVSITSAGNGWYRCVLTGVCTIGAVPSLYLQINNTYATGDQSFAGDGTSGIYFWGAQWEFGSIANTYVPTTTAAVYGTPSLSFSGVASIGLQSDGSLYETSAGTGNVRFYTNNIAQEQLRVSHTASAVNYVQVTGAATGGSPTISAQGSDANTNLQFNAKGYGSVLFASGPSNRRMFEAVYGTGSDANWVRVAGAASSSSPVLSAQGSDTNISQVFQSKGTGAIDLAAGSRGVNISNGGTVTAITRTGSGGNYTSAPSMVISPPTTAGGVQATVTGYIWINTVTLASGGTGYTVGDVLSITGGSYVTNPVRITVTGVSAGVITTFTFAGFDLYNTAPSNPASVTGGTGSGATFTLNFSNSSTYTITNAGSGYVEQPTVSFSGGGGSGAAAYATVGSGTAVRTLGSTVSFSTPSGEQMRVTDSGGTSNGYLNIVGSTSNSGGVYLTSSANAMYLSGSGGSSIQFFTNGAGTGRQFYITHTASAVNYVQVTGAATGGNPSIQTAGSDANRGLSISSKGTSAVGIYSGAGTYLQFQVVGTNSAVNYLQAIGTTAGNSPSLAVAGSDTNIDLALTPKGTGLVRFGTYTAGAPAATGYISIKAADGTTYKVLVGT